MKKRNKQRILSCILLGAFLCTGALAAFSSPQVQKAVAQWVQSLQTTEKTQMDTVELGAFNVEEISKEINLDGVVLEESVQSILLQDAPEKAERRITALKQEIVKMKIEGDHMEKVSSLLLAGYGLSDVMTAYRFLYEQYGTLDELEPLLIQKAAGNWNTIFDAYLAQHPQFVPSDDFEPEMLASYYEQGMTSDDFMIADRMAQREYAQFQQLMIKRINGQSWSEIKDEYGVVNREETLQVIALDETKIAQAAAQNGLSEEEAIDALMMAKKLNVDEEAFLTLKKGVALEETLLEKVYEKKFE